MRIVLSATFMFALATYATAADPQLIPPAVNPAPQQYVVEARFVETDADGKEIVRAAPTLATTPGRQAEIQVAADDGKLWTVQLEVNDGPPVQILQAAKLPAPCEGPDCLGVPWPVEELSPSESESFHELVDQFNRLFHQRRFAEAEVVAHRALESDPESLVAQTMKWKARFARRTQQQHAQACNEFHCGAPIPEYDIAESIQLTSRSVQLPAKDDWKSNTERALDKPISMYFKNVPLKEVVEFLSSRSGTNFVIDSRGLEEEGVKPEAPVTILVEDIKLRSLLKLVLEPLNLTYKLEDEVIKITSHVRLESLQVRTYQVDDLRKGKGDEAIAIDLDALSELIISTVDPDSWDVVGGPGSLRTFDKTQSLVVRQTPRTHGQIAELFEKLRRLSAIKKVTY